MSESDRRTDAADEADAPVDAPVSADLTGMAAFRRQLEAIADDRGLAPREVMETGQLANMPDVTPTAFAAIAGIVDCLVDADLRGTADAEATERNGTDDA